MNFQAGAYESESACKDFVNNIADKTISFGKIYIRKIGLCKFIAILFDDQPTVA